MIMAEGRCLKCGLTAAPEPVASFTARLTDAMIEAMLQPRGGRHKGAGPPAQ